MPNPIRYIRKRRREILSRIKREFTGTAKEWRSFLKQDTYLVHSFKKQIDSKLNKVLLTSVPWYFFWDLRLKRMVLRIKLQSFKIKKSLQSYNKNFVKRRISQYANFFDGADQRLSYPLDKEQKQAVVRDDTHNLVIAGAGSGKTSVLVARIVYLLERKDKVDPNKILVLAFNKKAVGEIRKRLDKLSIDGVEVVNFHQFGRNILVEINKKSPELLYNRKSKYMKLIQKTFSKLLENPRIQKLFCDYLSYFMYEEIEVTSFREKEEYYNYMRAKKYKTLNNIDVKSLAEAQIANFLFRHGVDFEYEPEIDWPENDPKKKRWEPDFYLPEYDIYIEHWGLSRKGAVPDWFNETSKEYKNSMDWKIQQFKKFGKKFIQTWDFERVEGNLINNLQKKLEDKKVKLKSLSYEELVEATYKFKENKKELTKSISRFISLAKSNYLSVLKVRKRINDLGYTKKQKLFAKLAVEVYSAYQDILKREDKIDYSDMIINAIDSMKKHKRKFVGRYSHVLVDEFQDISNLRLTLLQQIVNKKSPAKLFCVGDDWQSIYQFAGSEVEIFTNFSKFFPNEQRTYLKNNYRSIRSIVDMSSKLIRNNKKQISKKLRARNPIVKQMNLIELKDKEQFRWKQNVLILRKLSNLINENVRPEDIMVLSRFNLPLNSAKEFCATKGIPIEEERTPIRGVRFYTVHKSKGLEAKYLLLLDIVSGMYGFPCEIGDSSVFNIVRRENYHSNLEEERRLFYVALTRAKESIFLFTKKGENSCFLSEIDGFLTKDSISVVNSP